MFRSPKRLFAAILLLTAVLAVVDLPENFRLKFQVGPWSVDRTIHPPVVDTVLFGIPVRKEIKTHLGLDLSGGTRVLLSADMAGIANADRMSALESVREVIERRVNLFGVSEPLVQSSRTGENYRIVVELPGVTNVDTAVQLIGHTARLEFREFTDTNDATIGAVLSNTVPVGISGSDLKRARVDFSPDTGEPVVAIEFTPEGTKKFADVTTKLVGKPLAIFLDAFAITWPTVQSAITEGSGVISGGFSRAGARTLALQLNAGALPVPVAVVERRAVGASLGEASIRQSTIAGFLGLGLVAIFMIIQYGRLGLLADLALVVYGLFTFALFRLIPITLTLPGIAGFILSMGMAVDSNILIFERYREEKRKGKPWGIAMEQAFGRAWDSIRDANLTTLMTALILYNPGNWSFLPSSGLVRGFAVTLFLGVLVSLFTGIVVTRTFIRVLYKEKD